MSDLIERQVAIEALDNLDYMPGEWIVRGLTICKEAIRDLPSAQPEIVRCRDCKYGEQDDDGWWYCRGTGYSMGNGEKGDGFCSNAERRTDD